MKKRRITDEPNSQETNPDGLIPDLPVVKPRNPLPYDPLTSPELAYRVASSTGATGKELAEATYPGGQ